MLALGFVALFLVIGLIVFFVAFRGGPKTAARSQADDRRRLNRPVLLAIGVVAVLIYGMFILTGVLAQ